MGKKVMHQSIRKCNFLFLSTTYYFLCRSTVRDSSKRSSSSKKKKGSSSKKKAGKDSKSKPKDADPAKDFSEKDADPTKDLSDDDENLTADGESRSVLSPDIDEIIKQKEHRITIDSSLSQSNEHFCDINLRDVRMRELSISQDSESQSAADRILAVKNSLKKIAIIDPYDTSTTHKEVEEHDAHEEDEQETITAAELALMESLPFSYRTYDELVRLNREKSYAGLLQRKLEAYLTDEDFQIVFRKNRVRFSFIALFTLVVVPFSLLHMYVCTYRTRFMLSHCGSKRLRRRM